MTGYRSQWLYIPLIGGLDTKSDEKTVLPQDLVKLENGDYTEGGSLRFRAGYRVVPGYDQDGSPISNAVGLAALDDGWVMFTKRSAYSYDSKQLCWSELGAYCPTTHVLEDVAPTTAALKAPSCATAGGVTAVAWEDSRGGVRCSVFSEETDAIYAAEYSIASANASKPQVVEVGPNLLICWMDDANDAIKARVVLSSDPYGSVRAADVTLANDAHTNGVYDIVCGENEEAYLCFRQDPAVADRPILKAINSFGTVTRTLEVSLVAPTRIRLAYRDGQLWLAYNNGLTLSIRSYSAASFTLDYISSETLVSDANFAIGPNELGGVTVWADEPTGVHTANDSVHVWRRKSDATPSSDFLIRRCKVATNGWYDGAGSYCVLWYDSSMATNLQSTYFLYRDDGVVCGRMLYGSAGSMLSGTATTDGVIGRVSNIEDTDIWQCALLYRRQVVAGETATKLGLTLSNQFEHPQLKRCKFDSGAPVSAAELDGVLYASGSMLWAIDGFGAPVESSPLLFPDMEGITPNDTNSGFDSGGAGAMAAATYNYRLYYEIMYGRHKRARSAAIEVQWTPGAATKQTITYPSLTHTRYHARSNVSVVVYRSEGNKADFYYRITSADPTVSGDNGYEVNSTSAVTGTISDNLTDAALIVLELDYRSRGESVHFAPDGPAQLCVAQNRLFCAGGGERPDTIQYSFSTLDGAPAEFTDSSYLSELPEHGGRVVAITRVDNVPVVLFERGVATLDGVGYTNTGLGSQYVPEMVSSDVGCANARAVVPWDKGAIFQSEKGLYNIGQDGKVEYIGPGVERFNPQRYTGASVVPDTNIILFLCADDEERTAMYDYFYGKWGTYAQHFGLASATTATEYAYLRSDGSLYIRDPSLNQDGTSYIVFKSKTGPARTEGLEAAFLLRAFQLLGDYRSSHKIKIGVYYDNAPYPYQESEWLPDTVIDTSFWGDFDTWGDFSYWFGDSPYTDYHFERRFKRSRARSVQFEITVTPLASPGSSFEATEIAIEVAPIPGAKRLARTRKV